MLRELLLLLFVIQGGAAHSATVKGIVIDDLRMPVAGAQVHLIDPYKAGSILDTYVSTDSSGRFTIATVKPGDYKAYAAKPTSGYGDPVFAFFSAGMPPAPYIHIRRQDDVIDVVVNIGSPGGVLMASIIDSSSQAPIVAARYRLSLESRPDLYYSASVGEGGKIETPVPAMPIKFVVMVPGYREFTLDHLLLNSGERRSLVVKLEKAGSNKKLR
jgi:hypothetical protein